MLEHHLMKVRLAGLVLVLLSASACSSSGESVAPAAGETLPELAAPNYDGRPAPNFVPDEAGPKLAEDFVIMDCSEAQAWAELSSLPRLTPLPTIESTLSSPVCAIESGEPGTLPDSNALALILHGGSARAHRTVRARVAGPR